MSKPPSRKTRRPTIGADPFDALVPRETPQSESALAEPAAPKSREKKQTLYVPPDLLDAARDIVYHLSGPPLQLTLAAFTANAFRHEIERMEREHHKGKPFPKRAGNLRRGTPIR